MSRIVLADDGICFDGKTIEERPLGGVESSVIFLCEELARRGHRVTVCNKCQSPMDHNGVEWRRIDDGLPGGADLYIANRGDKLIGMMPSSRRTVFWIHNPARYLMKWRYLSKLWRLRPAIIFIGNCHAATYPSWAPDGGRVVIPYGIPDMFLNAKTAAAPPGPRVIFTSNPLRSLDWLLELWALRIRPFVPSAELHIFSGPSTYGEVGAAKSLEMENIFKQARTLAGQGVILRGPVRKNRLIDELRASRAMLYRGDINETFCLAVGEAQAMGVPAVVQKLGSVVERVVHEKTGFIADDDNAFAKAAVKLLTDDALWKAQHAAALHMQRQWGWPQAAARFEELILA